MCPVRVFINSSESKAGLACEHQVRVYSHARAMGARADVQVEDKAPFSVLFFSSFFSLPRSLSVWNGLSDEVTQHCYQDVASTLTHLVRRLVRSATFDIF